MAFITKDPKDTYLAILNMGDANEVFHATVPEPVLDAAGNVSLLELSQNAVYFTGIMEADVASGIVMDAGIDFTSDAVITDILKDKTDTDVGIHFTAGDPEASLAAKVGSIALRRDGSAGATMYVKETGTGNTGWEVYETFSEFLDLSDTPGTFTADKWMKVNSGGTAIEWADPPAAGALPFTDLTDTPASYGSQALKLTRVNAGETGIEFVSPFAETFIALSDTPGAFVANKMLKVNAAGTAVEFGDLFTTTTPARGEVLYHSGSAWVNLAVGTAGKVLTTQGASADPTWETVAVAFLGLSDVDEPDYTGHGGHRVRVNSVPDGLEFVADTVVNTFSDMPTDYSSDGDIIYTNGTDEWRYQGISFFMNEHVQYGTFPDDGEMMRKESTGMGWYPFEFPAMADTPSSYSGEKLAFLAVNTGETTLEFCCGNPDDGDMIRYDNGSGNWEKDILPKFYIGSGSPEGSITAVVGSQYHRTDGSATDVLYVKATGTGNTGWALVTTTAA